MNSKVNNDDRVVIFLDMVIYLENYIDGNHMCS